MKVHLISSMRKFDEDVIPLQRIADILHANGDHVALDWFSAVKGRKERQSVQESSLDWPEIVHQNVNAIIHADAVIIEGSRFNYSQGYQTAVALQHKKPVLNLYRTDLPEYKEWPDKFYVSGVSDPLFHSVPYEKNDDLEKIVTEFLNKINPKTIEVNFNIAIDQDTLKYIDALSYNSNSSRSAVIKTILTDKAHS